MRTQQHERLAEKDEGEQQYRAQESLYGRHLEGLDPLHIDDLLASSAVVRSHDGAAVA